MANIGLLERAERIRLAALADVRTDVRGQLGQFFTPGSAAALIASMLDLPSNKTIRVLDPGAGSGILSAALIDRVLRERPDVRIDLVAIERDPGITPHLEKTLQDCRAHSEGKLKYSIIEADFILDSTGVASTLDLRSCFDLVIENPPYGKLPTSSPHRQAMRASGLDVPNLYAAFLALSIEALRPGGQLVAITPRSFFNGPYFAQFRSHFLNAITLDRIHVFESRSNIFTDSRVLQENVVVVGTKDAERDMVLLSSSQDHTDEPVVRQVPYASVVLPHDPHEFIRLAIDEDETATVEFVLAQPCTLADLGVQVSTGRVVEFRSRSLLYNRPVQDSFPLVYPGNLRQGEISWPREGRKPQWFRPRSDGDSAMLLPAGWYTVVKRFSSKEEKRRIVSAVWVPTKQECSVAFENHLNVLHAGGSGLDEDLAKGLSVWLNSSSIDKFFRTFSGHTQVNATDLRTLPFPRVQVLRELGRHSWAASGSNESLPIERIAM